MTPKNQKQLAALDDMDRIQCAGINDECVRGIERVLVAKLMPLVLKRFIGEHSWSPFASGGDDDGDSSYGLALTAARQDGNDKRLITLTFAVANELTQALSLQSGRECTARITSRGDDAMLYPDDAYNTIDLRLADRQWLIENYSNQQLEDMKARVEEAITALIVGQAI